MLLELIIKKIDSRHRITLSEKALEILGNNEVKMYVYEDKVVIGKEENKMKKCDFCEESDENGKCFWLSQAGKRSGCEKAINRMVEALKGESK